MREFPLKPKVPLNGIGQLLIFDEGGCRGRAHGLSGRPHREEDVRVRVQPGCRADQRHTRQILMPFPVPGNAWRFYYDIAGVHLGD